MRVTGFDLSLTASGVATVDGTGLITDGGRAEMNDRLSYLHREFAAWLGCTDLAVVEDLPTNARYGGVALGMVHACFRLAMASDIVAALGGGPLQVIWPTPAGLKLYATGKGNASKNEMLTEAVRRLGYEGHDPNEADALWLRAMGLDLLGTPLVAMPAKNRATLAKVHLPEALTQS